MALEPHNWIYWGLELWLTLLAATILLKVMHGEIRLGDMFAHQTSGQQAPERTQLFFITVAAVAYYGYQGAALLGTGATRLPDVDDTLLALLAGSHGFYLFGKHQHFRGR